MRRLWDQSEVEVQTKQEVQRSASNPTAAETKGLPETTEMPKLQNNAESLIYLQECIVDLQEYVFYEN